MNTTSSQPNKKHNNHFLRACFCFLTLLLTISCFSINALAVWDGQGLAGDDSNATPVAGGFSLPYANVNDVIGYRFTAYSHLNSDGTPSAERAGHCVDIRIKTISGWDNAYHTTGYLKEDHIYHNDCYATYGTTQKMEFTTLTGASHYTHNFSDVSSYFTAALPTNPTNLEAWFSGDAGKANAAGIQELCGTDTELDFDDESSYIICEPIFAVTLEDEKYALTMAELAIYQSRQCGWTSFKGLGDADTYASNIMRYTSAIYGRFLYAVGEYDVFSTSPVTDAHIKNDATGSASILLPNSSSNRYNTAADVLEYQVGMGIYSQLPADNQYTVQYDGNGATGGSTASSIHYEGVTSTLTPNGFTKTGYTFVGWNTKADGSGTSYADKASVKDLTSPGGTITLYAKWEKTPYTVQYDGNGATGGSTASSKHYKDVASALTPNGFTKTGYTFVGWNTKADHSGTSYTDKASITNLAAPGETVTLYAMWESTGYTVNYDGNGATGGSTASSKHQKDVASALTANGFTRTGYTFKGWNTKANGTGASFEDGAMVTNLTSPGGTLTLYAKWEGNETTFKVNHYLMGTDGEYPSSPISTDTFDSTAGDVLIMDELIDHCSNHYTGLEFSHALANGEELEEVTVAWDGSTVVDLYYSRKMYVVSLEFGFGIEGVEGGGGYYYGETATINATVSEGYEWYSWRRAENDNLVTTIKNYSFTVTEDVYLNAIAMPIQYTIIYDGNGSTGGSTESSEHVYNVAKKLTQNGYERTDYIFIGWNTEPDGSGTSYSDMEEVKNLTTTPDDEVTLYAIWEVDTRPKITAVDRWFTLKDAQDGKITLVELMSTATVVDGENGPYTYEDVQERLDDVSCTVVAFDIPNYSIDDFTRFESAGSVTVTYYAKNANNKVTYETVTVYIVDESSVAPDLPDGNGKDVAIRFIDSKYYVDASGNFVEEAAGGLWATSKWVKDPAHIYLLKNTLSNRHTDGGWSSAPVRSFTFDKDTLDEMKTFINDNEPGKSLTAFYNAFLN